MDQEQLNLYSSFLSAIQSFVKEIVQGTKSQLNLLDMGNLIVHITPIPALGLELVSVSEKKDEKAVKKFHEKLTPVLISHQKIFPKWDEWDGNLSLFNALDYDIFNTLREFKSLIKDNTDFSKSDSIISENQMFSLKMDQEKIYTEEFNELMTDFAKSKNLTEKHMIITKLRAFEHKINDASLKEKININYKRVVNEYNDLKTRINYFVNQARDSVGKMLQNVSSNRDPWESESFRTEVRQLYLHLYSASSKFKQLGTEAKANEFKELSNAFLSENQTQQSDLYQTMNKVLKITENTGNLIPPIEKLGEE